MLVDSFPIDFKSKSYLCFSNKTKKVSKLIFLLAFALLSPQVVCAQLQVHQSFVSASGSATGTSFQTSWSIGEIFTESFSNKSIKVSHGINEAAAVYVITSINDVANGYHLYPNPFSSNLILEVPIENKEDICVEIFDMHGKMILPEVKRDNSQLIVSPGEIAPGIYLFIINKAQSFKIVKK